MTPQSSLLQLGKIVAKDMARGGGNQGLRNIGEALASQPDSVMEVLELLLVETRKKRPNAGLVSAFLFMLQQALEATRWRIENQSSEPTELIDRMRTAIAVAAADNQFPPQLLMLIAQCFAAAKLDIGDDLRRILASTALAPVEDAGTASPIGDFQTHLGRFAKELDHDPFLIHTKLAETFAGLLADQRIEMISVLAFSPVSSLREAAVGWLLDPDASIANTVAGFVAQSAGRSLVSGITVNRLITMRNWVNDDRRPAIDAAIRAARQHGSATSALSPVQIGEITATSCDGAGAQSFFVMTRKQRKLSAACLLVKHGFGIRDAWVAHGMSRSEVEALLDHIDLEVGGWSASLDAVQTILQHGLAVNARTSEPIPFALVQFIEATGLPAATPAYLEPGQLIGKLFEEIPANKRNDIAIWRALAGSKHWLSEFVWVNSWFDDSAEVLAAVRRERPAKTRTEAVLNGTIAKHRQRWGELLAWNALAARDDGDNDEWIKFTLVARELLSDRPIGEIPLAVTIARSSVAAVKNRL